MKRTDDRLYRTITATLPPLALQYLPQPSFLASPSHQAHVQNQQVKKCLATHYEGGRRGGSVYRCTNSTLRRTSRVPRTAGFRNQSTEATPGAVQPLPERVTFSHGGLREKVQNNTTTRDAWSQGCFFQTFRRVFRPSTHKKRPVHAQRSKQFSKKRVPSPKVGSPRRAVNRPYSLHPGHPLRPSPRTPASPSETTRRVRTR